MYKRATLNNGIRVVYEKIPYLRSVSAGIWVRTGSRNENEQNNGISHFVEHMMFKGTVNRSAKEIAESIDNVGGQLNAFTGKECTCYYTKTLDSHIDIAIDVLADMFFNSRFNNKDIDIEKNVVLEEINMYEDFPEDLVHDILSETVWDGNPLSFPILGNKECLERIDRDVILDYINKYYTPENCVISVAGNIEFEELLKLIEKYFKDWEFKESAANSDEKPEFLTNTKIKVKDTEQVHVCLGFEGIEHGKDELYSLLAVNNIFGGGMSSQLFQKIREEKGLAYSIYSYPSSYKGAGLFTIYAAMKPKHINDVIKLVGEEINKLISTGISEEDLEKSKNQLKGSYILGLESTSSRMNSIGKSELLLGRINTPEQILQKIDDINMDKAKDIIERIFDINRVSVSAVGNIKGDINVKEIIGL